jgi:hypothetical protein
VAQTQAARDEVRGGEVRERPPRARSTLLNIAPIPILCHRPNHVTAFAPAAIVLFEPWNDCRVTCHPNHLA